MFMRQVLRMGRMTGFAVVRVKQHINFAARLATVHHSMVRMSSAPTTAEDRECPSGSYEDAVQKLNELQSNADVIRIITANRTALQDDSIPGTIKYLNRAGVTLDELDSLNIIHVAGTKGKGSTCAFVESILRHAGLRTGFYSSPHLISVRERIRLDGKPLSREKFSRYFFQTYQGISRLKSDPNDMPSYFRFLTCMAFKVFLQERVDVAVIEVGIGGMYDSTNIIRRPAVVGITALGLDHQSILGDSVEEIALQKAGIMKAGVPAITVPTHSPSVQKVLEDHAKLVQCPFSTAPMLDDYHNHCKIELGINNPFISGQNAALSIQLANVLLQSKFPGKLPTSKMVPFELGKSAPLQPWHLDGLKNCVWPGRFQILKRNQNLNFYLDGAHTAESFAASLNWFTAVSPSDCHQILVFYLTGARKADALLEPFVQSQMFDQVIFCPIRISTNATSSSDNWSKMESEDSRHRCTSHAQAWTQLEASLGTERETKLHIFDSLEQVLQFSDRLSEEKTTVKPISVLVTGSLHLVGTFLSILDPNACD